MIRFDSTEAMLSTIRATMKDYGMVGCGSRVVACVSGGPDSVALLHVLSRLAPESDLCILVAHLDHCLRQESSQDADFVKLMAADLGLEFRSEKSDVRSVASRMGVSIEEAGRRCRYAFFEEVREALKADVIATAHHRDDELETFFLRICRGSSLKGLCGIPPVRGKVIRPLIRTSKAQILEFLENEGIEYRIDQTNFHSDTDRNFIRNKLSPLLADHFPDFRKTLSRTIRTLRNEDSFLEELASSIYRRAVSPHGNELIIQLAVLRKEPDVLVARVIMHAIYDFSGSGVRWAQSHLDGIMKVLRSHNPSAGVMLPTGIRIFREYDLLKISRTDCHHLPEQYPITVNGPGIVRVNGCAVSLRFRVFERDAELVVFPSGAERVLLDADVADFPLVLRLPQPGDRFRPWGLNRTRKVKKILIDMKVPLRQRKKLPLLVKDEEIIWIPGIRRGQAAPVESTTRRLLEVTMVECSCKC